MIKNHLLILSMLSLLSFPQTTYANAGKVVVNRHDDEAKAKALDDKSENYQINLETELSVDDNTLKPSISLFTRSRSLFTRTYLGQSEPFFDNYFLFNFQANSGINSADFENPAESIDQIISEYVADGGNIEFDLEYRVAYNNWDFSIGGYYSLLSTDAISTESDTSSVISVDAEIYGASVFASYNFNEAIIFSGYRTFDTSDDGQNADFTSILDNGEAIEFGIALPLSALLGDNTDDERKGYYLKLTRTKHSEVDKAIFRVSIQRRFDFK